MDDTQLQETLVPQDLQEENSWEVQETDSEEEDLSDFEQQDGDQVPRQCSSYFITSHK